jgi:hypothetical protein
MLPVILGAHRPIQFQAQFQAQAQVQIHQLHQILKRTAPFRAEP